MRRPFYLYRRKPSKMFYAGLWDMDERRYVAWRSVGSLRADLGSKAEHLSPLRRAEADTIVRMWKSESIGMTIGESIVSYLESFWSQTSAYARGKAARNRKLSEGYLKINQSAVRTLAEFLEHTKRKNMTVKQFTVGIADEFALWLQDRGTSARRINAIIQAIAVPLVEAKRIGKIPVNPLETFQKIPEDSVLREPMTPDEVRKFFSLPWEDIRHYAINMLAATTGMRLGECRGLKADNVRGEKIDIVSNWQDGEGLKLPKGGKVRSVPVPSRTADALIDSAMANPHGDGFVFAGKQPGEPISKREVYQSFNQALGKIGIKQNEIKRRKLTFHAWRHWYNSMMRGKIDDHALRRLTGHSSGAMTERYTEITTEQRVAVAKLAEDLI